MFEYCLLLCATTTSYTWLSFMMMTATFNTFNIQTIIIINKYQCYSCYNQSIDRSIDQSLNWFHHSDLKLLLFFLFVWWHCSFYGSRHSNWIRKNLNQSIIFGIIDSWISFFFHWNKPTKNYTITSNKQKTKSNDPGSYVSISGHKKCIFFFWI